MSKKNSLSQLVGFDIAFGRDENGQVALWAKSVTPKGTVQVKPMEKRLEENFLKFVYDYIEQLEQREGQK